jgi:4-amino-4-deoxy-L-arabinose transferase-like glycosyltransferase
VVLSKAARYAFVILALYLLFFFALGNVGLLGPDEPRYASIGREMARSGDWVTPRLWGQAWFEKPALLYWMTGLAFRLGIGEDLAPRLPVALASVAFLIFYYLTLRRLFGSTAAFFAAAILGTSAGWLALSEIGVTDLPMSAAFAAAMLLGLEWMNKGGELKLVAAGALLGLAVLAKGLVPLVLVLPLLWMARRRWRGWLRPWPILAFVAVAFPWYVLCTMRNGAAFLQEFFWRHHFERFTSGSLMHQQPVWYYIPILLAGFYPWTPLLALLFRRKFYADSSRRFLLAWLLFGFVFFSASTNKLPGYLLPLFPAAAALLGVGLAEGRKGGKWLLACCALWLALVPSIAGALPAILSSGLSEARVAEIHWLPTLAAVALAAVVWRLASRQKGIAVALVVAGVAAGVVFVKIKIFPALDRTVSARQIWREAAPIRSRTCVEDVSRNLRYGLNYYSVVPLEDCAAQPREYRIGPWGVAPGGKPQATADRGGR